MLLTTEGSKKGLSKILIYFNGILTPFSWLYCVISRNNKCLLSDKGYKGGGNMRACHKSQILFIT